MAIADFPRDLFLRPSSSAIGGYDYEFVDIIADKYYCNICTKVFRDAQLTECCGQHFCDSCLTQWLETQRMNGGCPHCRQMNFRRITNKALIREINEFRLYCTHRKEGCGWMGKLEAIENHLESDQGCGYVEVRCTNYGYSGGHQVDCGVPMERMYLANHQQNECEYRQYTCEHCGYIDTYDAIAGTGHVWNDYYVSNIVAGNHYDECDHYLLECPNECGEKAIKRMDMEAHQEICPLEPLDCPFKSVGCAYETLRKDMDDHTQMSMQAHLVMVLQSHEKVTQKNEELVQENEELTRKIEELMESNREFRDRLDRLENRYQYPHYR